MEWRRVPSCAAALREQRGCSGCRDAASLVLGDTSQVKSGGSSAGERQREREEQAPSVLLV